MVLPRSRCGAAWQTNNLGRGLVDNSVPSYLSVALRGVVHGLTMCGGMRGGLPSGKLSFLIMPNRKCGPPKKALHSL